MYPLDIHFESLVIISFRQSKNVFINVRKWMPKFRFDTQMLALKGCTMNIDNKSEHYSQYATPTGKFWVLRVKSSKKETSQISLVSPAESEKSYEVKRKKNSYGSNRPAKQIVILHKNFSCL